MSKKVTVLPIAMVRPNREFVSAPSRIRPSIEMTKSEFDQISDTARSAMVSLEEDGVSNPQQVITYNVPVIVQDGLKGWIQRCIVKSD